jgi:hypothetical protein
METPMRSSKLLSGISLIKIYYDQTYLKIVKCKLFVVIMYYKVQDKNLMIVEIIEIHIKYSTIVNCKCKNIKMDTFENIFLKINAKITKILS